VPVTQEQPEEKAEIRVRPTRRYTIRFHLQPSDAYRDVRVVTPMGDYMAVALATDWLRQNDVESVIAGLEIVQVESEVQSDPTDIIDYWNLS
jgi:hypothetical protein